MNLSNNYVQFDDFKVTHTKTRVVQYNEYYPFGLQTQNSWTRENASNNFLYNAGSELNTSTSNYEMFFREYDPALGRMNAVDPIASKYASSSTRGGYSYASMGCGCWRDSGPQDAHAGGGMGMYGSAWNYETYAGGFGMYGVGSAGSLAAAEQSAMVKMFLRDVFTSPQSLPFRGLCGTRALDQRL